MPVDEGTNTNSQLAELYLSALEGIDQALLDRVPDRNGLSGLFLPSVPPGLHLARQRIMIVGAETAGWNVLKPGEPLKTLDAYVAKAMAKHSEFFKRQLNQGPARGRTFFNFVREVASSCGSEGLIYSNLFCFDWKGGSPMHSKAHYKMVQHYSAQLLKAQVNYFRPDIIIFANGSASAGARRACFPTKGAHKVCGIGRDYVMTHNLPNSQLWEFQLHDTIRCFRIQHPSSRSAGATAARQCLLTLLPAAHS